LDFNTQKAKDQTDKFRFKIFERDEFRCFYCNKTSFEDGARLVIDHIYPKAGPGNINDSVENLVTCCTQCNATKKARIFSGEVMDRAIAEIQRRNKKFNIDDYTNNLPWLSNVEKFKTPIGKTIVRAIENNSVIKLDDGRVAIWQRHGFLALAHKGSKGIKLKGDTHVEVLKTPFQLATDFVTANSKSNLKKAS
jgi:hypothetical protein